MAKIMLVEDDTNLSEIYQARLQAEGYQIVSAHDGEQALAMAAKEKPDLIISDVMMPKISGFEMLDILRNTADLKSTKVIMLTALGQAEDKARAEGLGADRYLVKSQVTLEDIVKAAQDLLNQGATAAPASSTPTQIPSTVLPAQTPATTPAPAPATAPTAAVSAMPVATPPTATPVPPAATAPAAAAVPTPAPAQTVQQMPVAAPPATPAAPATQPVVSQPVATPPATAPVAPTPGPAPTTIGSTTPAGATLAEPISGASAQSAAPSITAADALAAATQLDTSPTPPVATATVTTPQPPQPIPTPTIPNPPASTAAADDAIVSNAVQSLLTDAPAKPAVTSTEPAPAPAAAQPAPATPPATAPVAPTPGPAPTTIGSSASIAPSNSDDTGEANDQVAIAHKKVIKPIGNPDAKPDLQKLLAAEEPTTNPTVVNGESAAPASAVTPHQPGNIYKPTTEAAAATPGSTDPGSIAL